MALPSYGMAQPGAMKLGRKAHRERAGKFIDAAEVDL
jgi:hypothetical protein